MKQIVVVSCLLLVVSLISGCGERTESTRYYYSPSWTKDGKIIAIGASQVVNRDVLGSQLGSTYTEYVFTIYPSGTGESSSLFDATGAPPYYMSCSPNRGYVAYLDELRNGLFDKITIRSISAESSTIMEEFVLNFDNPIKSFDWSSDGDQIVYCTTQEVRLRNWNDFVGADTLVTAESNLSFVSWQYGGRIAFVSSPASVETLSLIYSDGSGRLDLTGEAFVDLPQISSSNTNEVFGKVRASYCKVDISVVPPTTSEVKTSFTGVLPRLSPDATQIVYSKTGETSGIYVYVMDVTPEAETEIK